MRRFTAAACLAALAAGCGDDPSDPSGPGSGAEPGILHVHTTATGRWIPDGTAQVIVDDDPTSVRSIALNGTLELDVAPGDHTVELFRGGGERFYPACGVEGGLVREVTVPPGGSAGADFSLLCEVALELRVSTTGPSPDPDGYRLLVGPTWAARDADMLFPVYDVALDDTVVFDRDSETWWDAGYADRYDPPTAIYIWGEAPNCTFSAPVPIRLDPGGGGLTYDLGVECVDPPPLEGTIYVGRDGNFVAMAADGSGETPVLTDWYGEHWSLSPDGERVVFGSRDLFGGWHIGELATGVTTEVPLDLDYPHLSEPHWAVDGWIYFEGYAEADGRFEVYRIRPAGGAPERVTTEGGEEPELSPDGTTLLYNGPGGLTVSEPDGTDPRVLGDYVIHEPRWSPDGTRIAGHVLDLQFQGDHRLTVIDPATGETTILTSRPYHWWDSFAWSPDGMKLVYPAVQTTDEWWWDWDHDGDLFVVSVDGKNLARLTTSGDLYDARLEWRE